MSAGWEAGPSDSPLPPLNLQVVSAYRQGVIDIRWDDPSILAGNTSFTVVGVNVYRSDASDRGPYHRINEFPVGGQFYRDQTNHEYISKEVIPWATGWINKGDAPNDRRWVLRTSRPIVKAVDRPPYDMPTYANAPTDVKLWINGREVPVHEVFGSHNEITLVNQPDFNPITEKFDEDFELPDENATIEVSYYAIKNHVRSGLDNHIFYRVTTVVLDADAPSGYKESPLGYCPPMSTHTIETLDYIWREAIRRNHWILQQGGERVKLFVRKTCGVPCNCRLEPRTREWSKQPSNRCHVCFAPGTLVRTTTGYKPIESVQVGEHVLSADGAYHPVLKTFESPFTGDLLALRSSVSARPVLVTPEHPFLVLRGAHQRQVQRGCGPKCDKYIEQGDGLNSTGSTRLLPSGRWWARVQVNGSRGFGRKALGTFATRDLAEQAIQSYLAIQAEPGHVLKWNAANTLRKGDWLVAKWPADSVDLAEILIPRKYLKNTHLGQVRLGPDRFEVDADFLWMIGLYLAEGCKSNRSINFCLHRDEVSYQNRLVQMFTRWGFHPVVRPHADLEVQSAVVDVASTTLAEWFPDWLGDGCQNKRVPEELMVLPPHKLWALLQGLHDGDGSKRDREITQTSDVLALQIAEMLHRVGEQPLIRQQCSRMLTPKGNKRCIAFCVSWAEDSLGRGNRKGRWAYKNEVLAQVKLMGQVPFSGLVYNLEVEGDHTYVVQGVVTHNCYGTGWVGGYEGPYDVIIAPDDAERRISQTVQGRRKEHSYEVFMGPTPLMTQRDFLVKQTNERYSVGPVRRPTNRGNILQQHFTIAYLDEGEIRYQVPIDGTTDLQWPAEPSPTRDSLEPGPPPRPVDGAMTGAEPWPVGARGTHPMETEKAGTPDEREQRGRTRVWENIS